MRRIVLSIVALCVLGAAACAAETAPERIKPAFHFSADNKDNVALNKDGNVVSWSGRAMMFAIAPTEQARPQYLPDAYQGKAAVRFDGVDDCMWFSGSQPLKLGSLHIFIVARAKERDGRHFLLACGHEEPRLNFFTDGYNYRLETGDRQYKRRCGPRLDDGFHLFELSHIVPPGQTRLWPGDYMVDGQLCGKLFDQAGELEERKVWLGAAPGGREGFWAGDIAEVIIWDQALSDEKLTCVRHRLARKWGIKVDDSCAVVSLPKLKETRVGPADKFSSFGIYNESPESPDGTRIAYIVFDNLVNNDNPLEHHSLWVCDRDLQNHRMVFKSPTPTTSHNGAFVQWVDDDSIALCGTHGERIGKRDTERKMYVVNVETGEIEFGPYTNGFLGDNNCRGKVLMNVAAESNLGGPGLYQLDTNTGQVARLFESADFVCYRDRHGWLGRSDPADWSFTHAKFSPDGSMLAFTVHTGSGGGQHLFTCHSDGTELSVWNSDYDFDTGADKPLHFLWYDNQSLCGVDQGTEDRTPNNLHIKLWDTKGNYLKTLAGPGCHIAIAHDRNWVATENFYRANPIRLFVYKQGELTPRALAFEHDGVQVTWTDSGHVNPSFSRDNTRVYYNRPVDNKLKQAYYCDISQLAQTK